MQTASPSAIPFDSDSESLKLGSAEQRLILPALLMAGVGLALACFVALRSTETPAVFFHTYLVAYLFYLSITLGSLFFVVLHHLSRAGWSTTLRRVAEALAANIGLMAVLTIPILFGLNSIYPWAKPDAVQNGLSPAAKAEPATRARAEPKPVPSAASAGYLKPWAFMMRLAIYFVVWGFLAWYMRSRSILQDKTGDLALSQSMERLSAPGMIFFAFALTGAAFDLIMSMLPNWGSTILGVYFFANSVLGGLIVVTLLSIWLQAAGRLKGAITVEHYHDLGKLTFAFVFFWGYIAFSQFMLIWYANLPEETQFFIPRQIGPWAGVSIVLIFFHLLIPFLGMISRWAKRWQPLLVFWLVWMLVADIVDFFWLVMPNMFIQHIGAEVGMPDKPLVEAFKKLLPSHYSVYELAPAHASFMSQVAAPLEPSALLLLAALIIGMGGIYLASTTWFLKQAGLLVPIRDPRLHEALAFENS